MAGLDRQPTIAPPPSYCLQPTVAACLGNGLAVQPGDPLCLSVTFFTLELTLAWAAFLANDWQFLYIYFGCFC